MPTRAPRRPKLDEAVLRRLLDELLAEATLWDLGDIARALDIDKRVADKLARVAANYRDGAATQWPPAGDTLRQRLTPRGHAEELTGWPPYLGVLPPPATSPGERPRWRAGDVRRWAMQVGRMALDGTPLPAGAARAGFPAKVPTASPKPTLPDRDQIETIRQLCHDDTPWTSIDIELFFGVTQPRIAQWAAATREMMAGQWRHWPPLGEHGRGRKVVGWPPFFSMLPPPCAPSNHMTWRAGDVIEWGLKTGRIDVEQLLDWARPLR
jgi:hypothetical protein